MAAYPSDAYAPPGHLWWDLRVWPGTKKQRFGAEPRLAAWLNFNARVGTILTLRNLREVLSEEEAPNQDEHFGRRFRNLRKYGWVVHSSRDVAGLKQDEYRLDEIGRPIWLGKSKFTKKSVLAKVRREVFDRDGHRCLICGIGLGEPYPDDPATRARLTLARLVAGPPHRRNDPANLRTECSRCNAPAKEEAARSESAEEIWPKIRNLGREDKARLLQWIEQGHRDRDNVDRLFDQYRCLPPLQRDELRAKLAQAVKGSSPASKT
jgi:5-methylcytosine-specific restriction endonuclease McrA